MSSNHSNSDDWALIFIGLIIVLCVLGYFGTVISGLSYGVYEVIAK